MECCCAAKAFPTESIAMTTGDKYVAKLYAKLIFQQIPMHDQRDDQENITEISRRPIRVSVDDEEDRKHDPPLFWS